MRNKYGEYKPAAAMDGRSLVPWVEKAWSRPVQTEIEYPCDRFDVAKHYERSKYTAAYRSSRVQVRLEDTGKVYVSVNLFEGSPQSAEFEWDEFVKRIGLAMIGEGWDKNNA